jgi:transcriptional regulator with XRE-family HTH domain
MGGVAHPQYDHERDKRIWAAVVRGETQQSIADREGISQTRISQIVTKLRGTMSRGTKADLRQDLAEQLHRLRQLAAELTERPAPPAFFQGEPLVDPKTRGFVEDHSGRLAALAAVVKVQERLSKLLGLDEQVEKIDATTVVRYEIVGVKDEDLK